MTIIKLHKKRMIRIYKYINLRIKNIFIVNAYTIKREIKR